MSAADTRSITAVKEVIIPVRLLHTQQEAADLLGISLRSIEYMISKKQLLTRRLGGRVQVPRSEILRVSRVDTCGTLKPQEAR